MFGNSSAFKISVVFMILIVSSGRAEQSNVCRIVSSDLLEHAKLRIVWENELPMKEGESLDKLYIGGDCLYSLSEDNYIVCLNREDGSFIFGRSYAISGFPILGLELFEDELFSVIGNELVEIRVNDGTELSSVRLPFGVKCPAARNSTNFYIGGVDRRVHVLRADNKVERFKVAADNNSAIISLVAGEGFVIFGTEAGNVIAFQPDEPKRLWQFDTGSRIGGELVLDGGSVFAASEDTNVYRVDVLDGELVWK